MQTTQFLFHNVKMNKNYKLLQLSHDDKSQDLLNNLITKLRNISPTSNSSRKLVSEKEIIKKIDQKINEKIDLMVNTQAKSKIVDV